MNLTLAEAGERSFDVAIVGSGPAGLAAAKTVRQDRVSTVIIDEQPRAGGQILRQPPESFRVADWLAAPLYEQTKALLHAVEDDPNINWLFSTTVHGMLPPARNEACVPGHRLWVQGEHGSAVIHAKVVLLAPGCYERPLALPGWTLPGVMGAGAIQAFVKSQQFVPGRRFVFAGSHPLQLVVADQLLAAGADVAAVVFTQPLRHATALARHPFVALRSSRQLTAMAGILRRLRRAAVPVRFGRAVTRIEGGDEVQGAVIAPVGVDGALDVDRSEGFDCDRVGLCYGFSVSSELARQAGACVRHCPDQGGWLVEHDPWFETSVHHLFVAGEITGMAGADASLHKGRIAGFGLLRALDRIDDSQASARARAIRRRLQREEQFAAVLNQLSRPPEGLASALWTDETIVCRCESVTGRDLREALEQHGHIRSANALKLYTRAGMGMCQGRLCGHGVEGLVARVRDLPPSEIGSFNAQFPVKPLNLGLLGSWPDVEEHPAGARQVPNSG